MSGRAIKSLSVSSFLARKNAEKLNAQIQTGGAIVRFYKNPKQRNLESMNDENDDVM